MPESPTGVLCSFSPSSHCSPQCCAPKPWDLRTAPWHLPGRRALPERAKPRPDPRAVGLRVQWTAWRAKAGRQEEACSPGCHPGWRPGVAGPPPRIPAISLRSLYQQICKLSTSYPQGRDSSLELSLSEWPGPPTAGSLARVSRHLPRKEGGKHDQTGLACGPGRPRSSPGPLNLFRGSPSPGAACLGLEGRSSDGAEVPHVAGARVRGCSVVYLQNLSVNVDK